MLGVSIPPSSAGGTLWSSWTPRPRRPGTRASRQRPQAKRNPRTPAGTTPVQPAPDSEGADHERPRRNPLPGHLAVRRAPVRSEADREGRPAGDLPEVPAVPVGGQLPETPSSDEGGEEDLTGRPRARLPRSLRGGAEIVHRTGTGKELSSGTGLALRCRGTDRACDDDDGDGARARRRVARRTVRPRRGPGARGTRRRGSAVHQVAAATGSIPRPPSSSGPPGGGAGVSRLSLPCSPPVPSPSPICRRVGPDPISGAAIARG